MSSWFKFTKEDLPLWRAAISKSIEIYQNQSFSEAFIYVKNFIARYLVHIINRYRLAPRNNSEVNILSILCLLLYLLFGRFIRARRLKYEIETFNVVIDSNLSEEQKKFVKDALTLTVASDSNCSSVASFIESKTEILDYTFCVEFSEWLKEVFEHFERRLDYSFNELEKGKQNNNISLIYSSKISLALIIVSVTSFLGALNDFGSVILNYIKGHEEIYINIFLLSTETCINFIEKNDFSEKCNSTFKESIPIIYYKVFGKLILVDDFLESNFPTLLSSSFFWRRRLAAGYQRKLALSKEPQSFIKSVDLYQVLLRELEEYTDSPLKIKLVHLSADINADIGFVYTLNSGKNKKEKGEFFSHACQHLEKALKIYSTSDTRSFWGANYRFLEIIYRALGEVYLDEDCGDINQSIIYLEKAEEISIFSRDLAHIHKLLGKAHHYKYKSKSKKRKGKSKNKKIDSNSTYSIKLSILYLSKALNTFTPQEDPRECLEICRELGQIYISQGEYHKAIETFDIGIEAIEKNRKWIFSEYYKQQWQDAAVDIYEAVVKACLDSGLVIEALNYIERSKLNSLKEIFSEAYLYSTDVDLKAQEKINLLRRRIVSIQKDLEIGFKGFSLQQPTANTLLYSQLCELKSDLKKEIELANEGSFSAPLQSDYKDFSFAIFQQLLSPKIAIVQWFLLDDEFFTFVITKENFKIIRSNQSKAIALSNWFNEYTKSYDQPIRSGWRGALAPRLLELSKLLDFDRVIKSIPQDCEQLILVPHRLLHLLPLHALLLPEKKGQCLLDRLRRGVRYTPSCQMLEKVLDEKKNALDSFLGIQNPSEDLFFSELQVQVISRMFNTSQTLPGGCTKSDFLTQLKNTTSNHCVHFSCHGDFNENSPLESYLKLSKDEDIKLSEIFGLNLNGCHLITLSACETGLTDCTTLSDEYIGLPSGFLFAGASCVVSTLWKVDEIATAFLMIKFYENVHIKSKEKSSLQEGEIAHCLREAQLWIRDLTYEDFVSKEIYKYQEVIDQVIAPLSIGKRKILEASLRNITKRKPFPFSDPYYWAGFIATGF